MESRRSAFQILKPCCVRVNEIATHVGNGKSSSSDLNNALESLLAALQSAQSQGFELDLKLADYVFYPLSSVFRQRQKLSSRNLERALQCLAHLLASGWSRAIDGTLATQLLLLLTFIAGGTPNAPSAAPKPAEELQLEAFRCQDLLFAALLRSSTIARASLIDANNVPSLGHALTVLLDAARDAPSADVQFTAVDALFKLCRCVETRAVLASFLPGIVSSLSRVLTPNTKQRQPFKVLVTCLDLLSFTLRAVFKDEATFPLPATIENSQGELGEAWLRASSAQVKMALANVMRLRKHNRMEVCSALKSLCFTLLEDCSKSLENCTTLAVESLFALQQANEDESIAVRLASIVLPNPQLVEPVKTSLYNWLLSMPRMMLSNDDDAKIRTFGQIAASFRLVSNNETDMTIIDESLTRNLQDSIMTLAKDAISHPPPVHVLAPFEAAGSELKFINSTERPAFPSIFNTKSTQTATINALSSLVHTIASTSTSSTIAQEVLDQARSSSGSLQVTNAWLALNLIRSPEQSQDQLISDEFLALDMILSSDSLQQEDLYSFATELLQHGDAIDSDTSWQLQAIALEIVAFRASVHKVDFRPDLVDILYPVVHHLGSSTLFLRRHAAITLDSLASSCGYSSSQSLLVENSDYLINAISMKLNAFDIEPQAPQVLRMLTKLCGPRLIGYLDDIVDGVFEALDCFHSYPSVVEVLFSALGAVVEESTKSDVLDLERSKLQSQPKALDHRKAPAPSLNMKQLSAKLRAIRERREAEAEDLRRIQQGLPERTPRKPWAELGTKKRDDAEDAAEERIPNDEKTEVLARPYQTALRIANSIQYHLTGPSASARLSLLRILLSSVSFLSRHEDSFLPLINTLWPVLVPRLQDAEMYIVCATLDVMGAFAISAGDFMSDRFEKVWPEISRLWTLASAKSSEQRQEKSPAKSRRLVRKEANVDAAPDGADIILTSRPKHSTLPANQSHQIDTLEPTISISSSGSADVALASASAAGGLLTPVSTTTLRTATTTVAISQPSHSRSNHNNGYKYEATTMLRLRTSIITLASRLLTHVRLGAQVHSDIESWLTPIALQSSNHATTTASSLALTRLEDLAPDVQVSLEQVQNILAEENPDLLWLAQERRLWAADPAGRDQLWLEKWRQLPTELPTEGDGAVNERDFEEDWAKRIPGMAIGKVQWPRMVFST